jgi:transposase
MGKNLSIVHPNAAAIDVGSSKHFVCAQKSEVLEFGTFTEDCHKILEYFKSKKVTTVVMESTGVYWCALYDILEAGGLEVFLVNGKHAKNVPGRKSDVKDAQWLMSLHTYGLLSKSFIPSAPIRALRFYVRNRQDHIRAQATQIRLMQKCLILMNLRLPEVIDDIMGASGRKIIEAIIAGETDKYKLVELCHSSILKKKKEMVIKALEGFYPKECIFSLGQYLKTYDYYQKMINEIDAKIDELLIELGMDKPEQKAEKARKPIRYNAPKISNLPEKLLKLTNGIDPTGISGITDYSFMQIVAEIGTDLSAWKTEAHFASWLKLSGMKSSSGKMKRKLNYKSVNKAGILFRQLGATILTSKKLGLGEWARRVKARRGYMIAVKAAGRKIACYYYRAMTKGIDFVAQGIEDYKKEQQAKKITYLTIQAKQLNLKLVPLE